MGISDDVGMYIKQPYVAISLLKWWLLNRLKLGEGTELLESQDSPSKK